MYKYCKKYITPGGMQLMQHIGRFIALHIIFKKDNFKISDSIVQLNTLEIRQLNGPKDIGRKRIIHRNK